MPKKKIKAGNIYMLNKDHHASYDGDIVLYKILSRRRTHRGKCLYKIEIYKNNKSQTGIWTDNKIRAEIANKNIMIASKKNISKALLKK